MASEMSVWKRKYYLNQLTADPKSAAPYWSENCACVQKQQDYSCSKVLPRKDAPRVFFWKQNKIKLINTSMSWHTLRFVCFLFSRIDINKISNHNKWVIHRVCKYQIWILNYLCLGKFSSTWMPESPWCLSTAACINKTGHDNHRER